MTHRPDTPELAKACDMLREIYWREYGRGWRDAVASVKRVLEQPKPEAVFVEGFLTDQCNAGWRTNPETGERYNINDAKFADKNG